MNIHDDQQQVVTGPVVTEDQSLYLQYVQSAWQLERQFTVNMLCCFLLNGRSLRQQLYTTTTVSNADTAYDNVIIEQLAGCCLVH